MRTDGRTGAGRDSGITAPESPVCRFRRPLVEYLISGLEEDDKWVRILAADLLGCVGDARAVAYLKPLQADRDSDLRSIAAHSISMIHMHRSAVKPSEPDPCTGCMIRHIAEEALTRQKGHCIENCTSSGKIRRE